MAMVATTRNGKVAIKSWNGTSLARILYVSYDGLLEPIGQSQILSYLEGLSQQGVAFALLSFEKPGDMAPGSATLASTRTRLGAAGIQWFPLRYHKQPALLSTLYDIACGTVWALRLARGHRAQLLHVRSYVPAVMALPSRWLLRCPLLFDIRGFWVDERVEGGIWRRGIIYWLAKRVEWLLYRNAAAVVSLTVAGKQVVEELPAVAGRGIPIEVIPTCVDTDRFAPKIPDKALMERAGFDGKVVFTFSGSVGTWYALDQTLDFFRVVCQEISNAAFLFIVRGTGDELQAQLTRSGLAMRSLVLPEVPHEQVPKWLSIASVGMTFAKPMPSNTARFPTKIGEYLASGLPVVVSAGVGDCDRLIEADQVGVIIREHTPEAYRRAVKALRELLEDPALSDRCRQVALTHLSLSQGVMRYRALYRRLGREDIPEMGAEGERS